MIINHNMNALNAHRNMSGNTVAAGKSMEKLSSGLRINRAGDDAAGLAISEKMRGQIRGLDQASRNSQDGISMIQTAEGALNETHSILQRMRELAVQASSDTNTGDDRSEIQNEINQLTSEINRIGNTTEFNTQKVLDGGEAQRAAATTGTTTTPAATGTAAIVTGDALADGDVDFSTAGATDVDLGLTIDGIDIGNIALDTVETKDYLAAGTGGAGNENYDDLATDLATDINAAIDAYNTANSTTIAHVTVENDGGQLKITSGSTGADSEVTIAAGTNTDAAALLGLTGKTATGTAAADTSSNSTFSATLQIGANKGQAFGISINDMRAVALGIAQATTGTTTTAATGTAAIVTGDALADGDVDFSTAGATDVDLGLTIDGIDIGNIALDTVETKDYLAAGTGGAGNENYDDLATDLATDINAAIDAYNTANSTTIAHVTVENDGGQLKITSGSTGADSEVTIAAGTNTDAAALLGLTGKTATGTAADTSATGAFTTAAGVTNGTTNDLAESALDVSSHANATSAIEVLDTAIAKVSTERSKLGAYQNRLEHTIANLGTSSENLTSAESRIRDVDMAKEMMTFSKNNILSQAAQAMLAQANQQPQGVLQLLR